MKSRYILKVTNNLSSIFHVAIIALLLLSASGCGYKGDPYYGDETPKKQKKL